MLDNGEQSLRARLSGLFDDDAPRTLAVRVFNIALATLIIVNVIAVILESVSWMSQRYSLTFLAIERVATAIFAAEYLLRVWSSVDFRSGRFRDPLWGRLEYMRGFFPMIDLVAVLPAVLGLFGGADLRVLRLLRLLRMIKLTRHSTVFGLLWAVLRQEARAIAALIFVLCLTLTISGALMYMIEGDVQPTVFFVDSGGDVVGDRNGDDGRLWRHGAGDVRGARPRRHCFNHRYRHAGAVFRPHHSWLSQRVAAAAHAETYG